MHWVTDVIDFTEICATDEHTGISLLVVGHCRLTVEFSLSDELSGDQKERAIKALHQRNQKRNLRSTFPIGLHQYVMNSEFNNSSIDSNKCHYIFFDCNPRTVKNIVYYSWLTVQNVHWLINSFSIIPELSGDDSIVQNNATVNIFLPIKKEVEKYLNCSNVINDLSERYNVHRMIETLSS